MEVEFKYDIAFSLLAQDLELAEEIKRRINSDVKCFLYSDEQKELAGKNGVEIFKNIFKVESRLDVVLFRKGWGGSGWTGIEEDAMQDRLFKNGEGFLFLVVLDNKDEIPNWVPISKIWVDYKRLGIKGLISILEERVRERGKELTIETSEEKLKRIEKNLEIKSKIREILNGVDGKAYQMCRDEFKIFKNAIKDKISILENRKTEPLFVVEDQDNELIIRFKGYVMNLYWDVHFGNSLTGSIIIIRFQKREYKRGAIRSEYTELIRKEYIFDINMNFRAGWRSKYNEKFYTTEVLMEESINKLIEFFEKDVDDIKTFSD